MASVPEAAGMRVMGAVEELDGLLPVPRHCLRPHEPAPAQGCASSVVSPASERCVSAARLCPPLPHRAWLLLTCCQEPPLRHLSLHFSPGCFLLSGVKSLRARTSIFPRPVLSAPLFWETEVMGRRLSDEYSIIALAAL